MDNWNLVIDQFVKFLLVLKTAWCAAPWPVFGGWICVIAVYLLDGWFV